MKKHIPNMISGCNLLSGAIAVYWATQEAFALAFGFILLGAFFDFFDGMTARKLGVSGPLGIQMDSLADDITFGLAPSMMLFSYLQPEIGHWALLALLMAGFSALRLGKFNIDTRQTSSFIGLATPSNAIFWAGICSFATVGTAGAICLLLISFLSCYLLICEIPFFSLKFKTLRWQDNKDKFTFLIGVAAILLIMAVIAIVEHDIAFLLFAGTLCISWYVGFNLVLYLIQKH